MFDGFDTSADGRQWLLVILPAMALAALLPTFIALALKRKDWRRILAFNLVAALSWPAWIATLAWAVTGIQKGGEAKPSFRVPRWFWPTLVLILVAAYLAVQFARNAQ